jgi:beta-lactamase regulating signal transducer with metallopeptidase domain
VLLAGALKRRSASLRQAVLSTGIAVTLVSAFLVPLSPHWMIPTPEWLSLSTFDKPDAPQHSNSTTPNLPVTEEANLRRANADKPEATARPSDFENEPMGIGLTNSLLSIIALIWLAGTVVLFGRFWKNLVGLKRLREASSVSQSEDLSFLPQDARGKFGIGRRRSITVLQNETIKMPLTWGVLRHFILLPMDFEQLPAESRRAVMIHESAHIKRLDFVVRMLAEIMCATLWFQPLVWIARRKLREEQERAADDRVLAAGEKASGYAKMLLELYDRIPNRSLAMAVGIAGSSSLKARLEAILSPNLKRRPPSMSQVFIIALLGLGLAIPFTTLGFSRDASLNLLSAQTKASNGGAMRLIKSNA